ncbi:unnamed protein product [Diabrotica balteata]|uniref:Uncharacterized protein n=1 Tax=Diabrotica balteata TaxID=107213 RepID=A0A9N9X8N3_DIABA|nr:unnamed protein product [Diabrotica balteata]
MPVWLCPSIQISLLPFFSIVLCSLFSGRLPHHPTISFWAFLFFAFLWDSIVTISLLFLHRFVSAHVPAMTVFDFSQILQCHNLHLTH